jgi:hypothetical protein
MFNGVPAGTSSGFWKTSGASGELGMYLDDARYDERDFKSLMHALHALPPPQQRLQRMHHRRAKETKILKQLHC